MNTKSQSVGRVASPPGHESTSVSFYFWIDRAQQVERTQLVMTRSTVGGKTVLFTGIVQEVYRCSRQRDMGEESARFDSRTSEQPPFDSEGVTYAEVSILCTEPVVHAPPREESEVFLADDEQAARGYGMDRMGQKLEIGMLRNGGTLFAGHAAIDLDFLLGKNGGHLNVNGIAGLGTKSTLLLTINWLLQYRARQEQIAHPGSTHRLQVVSVIFNVKNFDLFHLDRWNKDFKANEAAHRAEWALLGIHEPTPFQQPQLFAPQAKGVSTPVATGSRINEVLPYSWSLSDIIELGLFKYLFSEEVYSNTNAAGLIMDVEEWLTGGTPENPRLKSWEGIPQNFEELLQHFQPRKDDDDTHFRDFSSSTRAAFYRRLKYIVKEGDGVLRRNDNKGNPLRIPNTVTGSPIVIDLYGLFRAPSLQRFVVASVFHQIMAVQSSRQTVGLKYLITLDELNRFAPRGGSDPITEQIELVAAEGRSQGIILLGAQQQASLVSSRVIENSAIRAVGRSGTLELEHDLWKFLGISARRAASQLQPEDKLLYQPSFREPMLAKIPFPPFALSGNDVWHDPGSVMNSSKADLDSF